MLSGEEKKRLYRAVVHPDVAQSAPLIMPAMVAQQFAEHILDAVEGRKVFDAELLRWVRDDDAAPQIHVGEAQ